MISGISLNGKREPLAPIHENRQIICRAHQLSDRFMFRIVCHARTALQLSWTYHLKAFSHLPTALALAKTAMLEGRQTTRMKSRAVAVLHRSETGNIIDSPAK